MTKSKNQQLRDEIKILEDSSAKLSDIMFDDSHANIRLTELEFELKGREDVLNEVIHLIENGKLICCICDEIICINCKKGRDLYNFLIKKIEEMK